MGRDSATTDRLRNLIAKLQSLTASGELHWEKQAGSAHRYARWNNHLVILGPSTPLSDTSVPRYLFITPFDSPDCIEINSDDAELGSAVIELVRKVEAASKDEAPTDPFAVTDQLLERLESHE
ncbi:MAG TPA: hypothetical protein VK582_01675 [Pyrinomonadaceae bacterium]|nr:hypothetical protein [Pyrinomonadaceae bacterium]